MGTFVGESHASAGVLESELGVTMVDVKSGPYAGAAVSEEGGEPVFFTAGRKANGEFHCSECGYGVIVRTVLPACPMCRGLSWEEAYGHPSLR